ncbi:gamma-1-syntrophin-like isoform X2 [Tubulanus polymorphus]|uniref:gamma-1-syntrophin-like isoform X2 n=1 Tax=Tubulanus polymorphus TaxID=672921 RepID=UPI003DA31586
MDLVEPELKQGMVVVHDGKTRPQPVKLCLTEDSLTIKKEELVYVHSSSDEVENSGVSRERTVTVKRERIGGLGLSIKGGAEHHLPILVSRIFKDQAADKTGQLFVGDAITKVNGVNIEKYNHDNAVLCLRDAGEDVMITVKHFRPASLFLTRSLNRNSHHGTIVIDEDGRNKVPPGLKDAPKLEKHWADLHCIPLHFAHVTWYDTTSDKQRTNGFEVIAMDGTSTGVIHSDNNDNLNEWVRCINNNIQTLNNHSITMSNRLLLPNDQIIHMCWTAEKISLLNVKPGSPSWKPRFIAMRGSNIYFFETPPVSTRDWLKCDTICKVYESMFRVLKDTELLDDRNNCYIIQAGSGESFYLSVETRHDMLRFEKAWFRANYLAVMHLKNKTFGCSWRNRICGLTLDLQSGFSLYDSESRETDSKCYLWSYKFSQLKGSADDGKNKLTLHFITDMNTRETEIRELECTNLQTLLFSMHAFLSAKLASVDPAFLRNI